MKAFKFTQWKKAAELTEVETPEPGPGEALIKIGGAGVCHSDLHIMHEWTPELFPPVSVWKLPFILGHENAGWLEYGEQTGIEKGTPVVVSPTWSCGVCRPCRQGYTNCCEREPILAGGLGLNGGFAEYMVAPVDTLIPLREIEPWQAAPLTDAGLSAYHAVKLCLPMLTPDTSVVVIGVGGLGQMAIQFLRELSGAQIIATARSEKSLKKAEELGAHLTLPSDDKLAKEVKKATRGLGAMAVLDFVGNNITMGMSAKMVRKKGQVVLIGLGGGQLSYRYGKLPFGSSIISTLGGTTGELVEVVALAEAGRIAPEIEKHPLDQVAEVYDTLAQGKISGRAVIVP